MSLEKKMNSFKKKKNFKLNMFQNRKKKEVRGKHAKSCMEINIRQQK